MALPQLVQWVSGALEGLFPAWRPETDIQPSQALALGATGLVDPAFIGADGGNSASTYPVAPGSKIDGGLS